MGASTAEQYCLKWNDFQSNITTAFSDIRDEEDFLDVTLVADGQTARAHKLVLSACSPLFKSMLKKNTHAAPMIFLHGIRYGDVISILNFMYQGEVNVNQEDLETFLAAAEELRIRGLSDRNSAEQSKVAAAADAAMEQHTIRPRSGSGRLSVKRCSRSSSPSAGVSTPLSSKGHKSPQLSMQQRADYATPSSSKRSRDPSEHGYDVEDGGKRGKGMIVTPDLTNEDNNSSSHDDDGVAYNGFGGFDPVLFSGASGSSNINVAAAARMAEELSSASAAAAGDHVSSLWFQRQSAALMLEQQQYIQQQLAQQQQQQRQPSPTRDAPSTANRPVCNFCRKELKNLHSLNVHISRYHSETNENCVEMICPVCERTYGNKYSLRTHMHLNHKEQLHLLSTAKKSNAGKKASASASAAAAVGDNDDEEMAKEEEPYYVE